MAIIFQVSESVVVRLWIDVPRDFVEVSEDISCTSVILPSLISGAELSIGHEQVDVVGADKVLSHVDDGHGERHFAVVIG